MRSDITDRMKKNAEIGRIAMLQLRSGMDISDKTARLVATTVENPDVGRNRIEADGSQDALAAVWILDDAENMAADFSDLEARLNKLRILLEKEGYALKASEEKKKPFTLVCEKEEADGLSLIASFGSKKILELTFGATPTSSKKPRLGVKEMESQIKDLQAMIKLVKKLNGLGIKGEEKTLRLALFSIEERHRVREARARRLENDKSRGSV